MVCVGLDEVGEDCFWFCICGAVIWDDNVPLEPPCSIPKSWD